jgi:hypothetical protein
MKTAHLMLLVLVSPTVYADNAALWAGGRPRLMDKHPQVQMVAEDVLVVVRADRIKTECTFVFRNGGTGCKVRMGFPDFGLWAYAVQLKKPKSMFTEYASFVEGRKVPTKLVLGDKPGEQWQTKTVAFPTNGSVTVKEVYSTKVGGIAGEIVMGTAAYLVHTGASWNGPIKRARIRVRFEPDTEVATPMSVLLTGINSGDAEILKRQIQKPGGLVATGPCQPVVQGRTLVFEKQNWKPSDKDDIYVFYRYPQKALEAERAKAKALRK